jgi:hypothetical protein
VQVQVRVQVPSILLVWDEAPGNCQLNLALTHHVPSTGTSGERLAVMKVKVMHANFKNVFLFIGSGTVFQ